VDSGLGSATSRRRRLILLGATASALAFLGLWGLHGSYERAAAAANPRFLWSVDAASAARSLLNIPDGTAHEPSRALSSAPWLERGGLGDVAARSATTSATTAPALITTPMTAIVSTPEPTPLDKVARIDHRASWEHRTPAVQNQLPAASSSSSHSRARKRGVSEAELGSAALDNLEGLPGSMDVQWHEGSRPQAPTTERQLQPTRLRANRSPRGALR
jgi:hypothetical protein